MNEMELFSIQNNEPDGRQTKQKVNVTKTAVTLTTLVLGFAQGLGNVFSDIGKYYFVDAPKEFTATERNEFEREIFQYALAHPDSSARAASLKIFSQSGMVDIPLSSIESIGKKNGIPRWEPVVNDSLRGSLLKTALSQEGAGNRAKFLRFLASTGYLNDVNGDLSRMIEDPESLPKMDSE